MRTWTAWGVVILAIVAAAVLLLPRFGPEARYARSVNSLLGRMQVLVEKESGLVGQWEDAAHDGTTAGPLPPAAVESGRTLETEWEQLLADMKRLDPPPRHERSHAIAVRIIELRLEALRAFMRDPLDERYDMLWQESQRQMDGYVEAVQTGQ